MIRTVLLSALASATALSGAVVPQLAAAQIVYDNGAPTADGGNETTAWVQSEDFSFATATTIGGAGVYLSGAAGNIDAYDGSFQYYIFDDNGGIPGTVLASGAVTPTITDSGIPAFAGNSYLFQFTFADFTATAGTTYHFGIHASGVDDYSRDEIYWTNTALNGTATGVESFGGTFDNWSDNGAEHAFFLTGAGTGTVPEPATWGLMILGFGAVGSVMRRRSTRVAFA